MQPNYAVTDISQSPNYSPGRPYGPPDHIVIHHWGSDGQSHDGVVAYLCRFDGDSSAHYVASDGRVTQLVSDNDRAWHAGTSGNPTGIGIECRPEMTDGDVETVIGLIAAIRSEWGPLPLVGHCDHMPTTCPGRWYARLGEISDRANGSPTPTPAPAETTTHRKDNTPMHMIRTVTPWGDYAYALVTLSGIGGARAIDQAEADIYYKTLGVTPVGWETWNALVERAWQAHNATLAALGQSIAAPVADAVRAVIDEARKLAVPAPTAAIDEEAHA